MSQMPDKIWLHKDTKEQVMRDIAWKVHAMISEGKSIAEIDHYVCGMCDF